MTRLHRVTWVDSGWLDLAANEPYHPLFVPLDLQGGGRFDNPHLYAALYAAETPAGAVGETFGSSATWLAAEIERSKEGRPRCLVSFDLEEGVLEDLDDPNVLVTLGLRPSDVVRRNRDHTQEVAQRIWRGGGKAGLSWRSYWRPEWSVAVAWTSGLEPPWFLELTVVDVEGLSIDHPAVRLAADVLPRVLG